MATNLLSLPLLSVTFETANNESWRDSVAFATAGSIATIAKAANAGNGTVTGAAVSAGAYIGDYALSLTGPTTFNLFDPDGYLIGAGAVGGAFAASGVAFTITAGSIPFAAGDSFVLTTLPQPIDLTGIRFVMQMRAANDATAQVLLTGDTDDGTLINGTVSGVLSTAFPPAMMKDVPVSAGGTPHVLDVLGIADGDQRRCVSGTNNVVGGITFPAN